MLTGKAEHQVLVNQGQNFKVFIVVYTGFLIALYGLLVYFLLK